MGGDGRGARAPRAAHDRHGDRGSLGLERGVLEWAWGADLEEEKKKLEELLEEVRVEATTVVCGVPQHVFDPYREREDFCRTWVWV